MTGPCSELILFADGELDAERAEAFRSHLASCDACRTGLVEAIQLGVRLGGLTPGTEQQMPAPSSCTEPVAALPRTPAPVVPLPLAPAPVVTKMAAGRKRWVRQAMAGAVAAAAMLAVILHREPGTAASAFAGLTHRPYEVRIAYADATAYRPIREVMRGTGASVGSSERISFEALGRLEKRNDGHALAIAGAWNGDESTKVADQLRKLQPQTLAIRSDLAAMEILTAPADNAEAILSELEKLQASGDPKVARAARWNYAILLSRLDLPLSAAQAFRAIADENEPGWSEEARERARPDEQRGQDFQTRWGRAYRAGEALVTAGAPVPSELVRAFPSLLRAYFYIAVRAAPTRDRVLALAPMAAELDRLGGQHILGSYVDRVAKLDFTRRAPLAAAYAQLLQGAPLTDAVKDDLISPGASSGEVDIAIGSMIQLGGVPAHLEAFRAMVKQTGDPWFEIALAMAEATVATQHSKWLDAEASLRNAEKLCSRAVTYQCIPLARQLGGLYADLNRVHDALTVLRDAARTAHSAGEWGRYRGLLWQLADVERFHSATATVRAYANEVLRMEDSCEYKGSSYRSLAGAALLDVDGRAARRYFDEASRCEAPDLVMANLLTDIARLDPQPGDLPRLQDWLGKLRSGGTLSAAEQVLADEIEGRLVIESDPARGTGQLERAIARADAKELGDDVVAAKARAGAYSVLVFAAARRRDHARVLSLIARDLGLPAPGACTVGMVAEDERAAIAVRDAGGHDDGSYEGSRGLHSAPLAVSAELARGLTRCAHVQVLALAALQGQPRVLPETLAWSYATGAHAAVPASPSTEPRTLIVTNVVPPTYLKLPALSAEQVDRSLSVTVLSGPEATPARVKAEMLDASEIQFHTHALMDVGLSDASHLVLSPEANGNYALTAEAIRGIELAGHPVIVLAACDSAQGARYQHAPWSLPNAFLTVGARGVFASAREIPDREAGRFFGNVLARVRSGVNPALALRDERMTVLSSNPASWVADVILFE